MLKIRNVKLSELESLIHSEEFKNWQHIPVSQHRALSYINNPRANPEDIVLFLGFINGELVSYRTVLPDTILQNNRDLKFAWFSGNWVHPAYRRQGISTAMLNAVNNTWKGRLLFTNYAPVSKSIYDKSDYYKWFHTKEGIRYYFKSCLAVVLPPKAEIFKRLLPVLKVFDYIANLLINLYFLVINALKSKSNIQVEEIKAIDSTIEHFINQSVQTITQRKGREIKWILNFPWIKEEKFTDELNKKYHFSTFAKSYHIKMFKLYDQKGLFAFLIFKERNNIYDLPFVFYNENSSSLVARFISKMLLYYKPVFFTLYDKRLLVALSKIKTFAIMKKKMERKYFASPELIMEIEKLPVVDFQDGDGDCAFT